MPAVLSPPVVEQSEASVGLAGPLVDADRTAQRRHMTVMFCDLVGSTPLAESLDPEDFREVLSGYQLACARAIERFDGCTAKYVGDGLVAYFGYPRAHEDNAQRAVHAGLGILDELTALNSLLRSALGISLRVRIGLHTGVVVAGEMGAGEAREQLAIVGETPHIAARLESIAPPGSVVISDATRDLVDGYFETEPLGKKALKGVSRPIGVHRVLRPTGAESRLEAAAARRLTPMVGRDSELARLAEAWEQVQSGGGAIAHITGEAGIGKSRLVRALLDRLGKQADAKQIWQCSAHHGSTPLYPVTRVLERLRGLDPAELDQVALEAGLDPAEAVPLLADLLSLRGAGDIAETGLTPRDARTATLRILESLLVTGQPHQPLLLIVEDLHWADPTTVELLGRIITGLRRLPVLCLFTFRPEFEPPWRPRQPLLEIELGPLKSEEVRAMVAGVRETALDPAVTEWVDSAADGVPLFVEEMLKTLADADGPGSVGHVPSATVVPPTLQGLLTARLDRLGGLSEVVDMAAVLGREFELGLLEALAPLGGSDLGPALAQLALQDVVRPVDGAGSRYEFTHAMLQEAAYERLLRRRRRALHGRVADILVRGHAAVAERRPELIAHHWSCAAEPAKAIPYWHAAGTRALERAAYLEAATHSRRGLEDLDATGPASDHDLERIDFLTRLAASLQAGRGYAASGIDEAYAKARSGCERVGSRDRLVAVLRGQWMFHLLRAQYSTALELAEEMLALAKRGGNGDCLAEGHLYRGLVHMYLADFDVAREHLDEAFARYRPPERSDHIYEAQGDTGVGALAYLALVLWNLGHAEEARERSDLSLERAERIGGPVTRAQAWGMRSILHLSRAEPVEFGQWVDRTRAHSVDHDVGYWRIVSSLLSGWLRGRAGEVDLGMTRVEEGINAYLASGSRLGLAHFHVLLADLRLAAGDRRGALDELQSGEEHMEATGERFSASELFRVKGRVLAAGDSPDHQGATAAYERAVDAAREQNAKLLELRAATRLAGHQREIGEPCTALERVAALCDCFTPGSELPEVARARALLRTRA